MPGWFSDTQKVRVALEHGATLICPTCLEPGAVRPCARCKAGAEALDNLVANLAEMIRSGPGGETP